MPNEEDLKNIIKINKNIKNIIESQNIKMIEDSSNILFDSTRVLDLTKLKEENKELYDLIMSNFINIISFFNEKNIDYLELKNKLELPYDLDNIEDEIISYFTSRIKTINNKNNNSLNKNTDSDKIDQYLSYYELMYSEDKNEYIDKLTKIYNCLNNKDKMYSLLNDEIEGYKKELTDFINQLNTEDENYNIMDNSIERTHSSIKKEKRSLRSAIAYFLAFTGIIVGSNVAADKSVEPRYNYHSITLTSDNNELGISDSSSKEKEDYLELTEFNNETKELIQYHVPTTKEYSIEELRQLLNESFDKYNNYLISDIIYTSSEQKPTKKITYYDIEDRDYFTEKAFKFLVFFAYSFFPVTVYFIIKEEFYDEKFAFINIYNKLTKILSLSKNIKEFEENKKEILEKTDSLFYDIKKINQKINLLKEEDILKLIDTKNTLMQQLEDIDKESSMVLSKERK